MPARSSLSLIIPAVLVLAACASTAVEPPPPDDQMTIALAPVLSSIDGGATLRLRITVRKPDGSILHPADAVWRSSDLVVATVGEGGLVRGGAPGTAEITARWQGATGKALVKVVPVIIGKHLDPPCPQGLRIPGPGGTSGDSGCRP